MITDKSSIYRLYAGNSCGLLKIDVINILGNLNDARFLVRGILVFQHYNQSLPKRKSSVYGTVLEALDIGCFGKYPGIIKLN